LGKIVYLVEVTAERGRGGTIRLYKVQPTVVISLLDSTCTW